MVDGFVPIEISDEGLKRRERDACLKYEHSELISEEAGSQGPGLRIVRDPSIKTMTNCASGPIPAFSKVEKDFPYQIDVKFNRDEVESNLRGIEDKPGLTRPATSRIG